MKERIPSGKREKLENMGVIILILSQILYVLHQISGYVLRVAILRIILTGSYFVVNFTYFSLHFFGICLIAAGIYRRKYNGVFFTGCAFLVLDTLLALRTLLSDGFDRTSLSMNSLVSVVCRYISIFSLFGMIAGMMIFVLKKRGRIAGEIFAVTIIVTELLGIYRTIVLILMENSADLQNVKIILLHNSLFILCTILSVVGFLVWFYANGLAEETEGKHRAGSTDGKWLLTAGSFFFLLSGISGIALCFMGFVKGIDFLVFILSAVMLGTGLYGLANSRSRRHAKTCAAVGGIQVIIQTAALGNMLFWQDGVVSVSFWMGALVSILLSLLYAAGGWKNMR